MREQCQARNSMNVSYYSVRNAITKIHKLGGLQATDIYFSHFPQLFLDAGKTKTKLPASSVSGEGPLPGSQTAVFLLCLHAVGGVRKSSPRSLS